MSHSRVRELDLEDLDALPDPCRGCLFWQTSGNPAPKDPQAQDAWWRAVQLDWGAPGKAIWHDGTLVAYALYAPALHVQRTRSLPLPASDDAVVLATMWTHPDHRGGGHARHLLQVVAREALARNHKAVEAYGTSLLDRQCLLDGSALEALGFTHVRSHPTGPALYRLDLDRTIRWPHAVGHALGEVIASLQGRERAQRPALERRGEGS